MAFLQKGNKNVSDDPEARARFTAIQKKYEEERRKRLRQDGETQYTSITDVAKTNQRYAKMLDDPWASADSRKQMHDEVEIAIVGGGFAGVCMAARLRREGVLAKDIRIIDSASDVGGTWYWNRYPGAQCDIESYIYLPFLEELKYVPKEKYSHQSEIMGHAQAIMRHYSLYDNACFRAAVTGMQWEEALGKWKISTSYGDLFHARYAVVTFGTFGGPKLPSIPGIDDFKGHMFHTARWDYTYTGGSNEDSAGMSGLADKNVAIIGTGATSVQVVPHVAKCAKHLYIIQRTPSGIGVRGNHDTTPEFAAEHLSKSGWHEERRNNFLNIMFWTQLLGTPEQDQLKIDLIQDGWTKIAKPVRERLNQGLPLDRESIMQIFRPDGWIHQMQEDVRARVDELVHDKATADALKPWYMMFCKRPCFHDQYLQTFNRPNVSLVDTDGKGPERITRDGIVVDGKEIKVDCIVMSTGFGMERGGESLARKLGFDPIGRGGLHLTQKWSDGVRSLNGLNVNGFPNLWMISAPHSGVFIANVTMGADMAALHIAHVIASLKKQGLKFAEPTIQAEEKFCEWIVDMPPPPTAFNDANCTPGYYNAEGQTETQNPLNTLYPKGVKSYFELLADLREKGQALEGFHTVAPAISRL